MNRLLFAAMLTSFVAFLLGQTPMAHANNYTAMRAQEKAVCESNCYSTEGQLFFNLGGPFTGPNATQKCLNTCACIDMQTPHNFSETEFMSYLQSRPVVLTGRYDAITRQCVGMNQ